MANKDFSSAPDKGDFVLNEILEEYLYLPTDSTYHPVGEYNAMITRSQALEDLDELFTYGKPLLWQKFL